jgi:hypothetical protein
MNKKSKALLVISLRYSDAELRKDEIRRMLG